MTGRELWNRYRALLFDDARLGVRLDLSRLGVGPETIDDYAPALHRALEAMTALEAGALANADEGRMVGHYWLRAPALAPTPEIADAIRATHQRIHDFAGRVHSGRVRPPHDERFGDVLLIGIGGSALGPQLLADGLAGPHDRLRLHFMDNTDPDGLDRVLTRIGGLLPSTLVLVVSKSGGTPETRNGMLEVAAAYAARGLKLGPHAVAITQQGSTLDRYAIDHGFIDRFPMWDWVGGRTSITSAVGLLPAALQGIDIDAFLAGAALMDEATRRRDTRANPAALMALAWHVATEGRGTKDLVVLPYKDRLALFARYLQQLVMESLGKQRDRDGRVVHQGLTVYGNKGSTDQHAYVQQLRDGLPNFCVTFVRVLKDRQGESLEVEPGATSGDFLDGFMLGTRRALFENGRRSITLTLSELGPTGVGMLVALFERAVGLYATLINVNAYDQPGVEAGKKAAAEVLALQRRVVSVLQSRAPARATAEQLADAIDAPEEVETVLHILEHLSANEGRGVSRRAGTTPWEAEFGWRDERASPRPPAAHASPLSS